MPWILTKEQKEVALGRYVSGESAKSVATALGVHPTTISTLAARRGLRRTNSEAQRSVPYNPAAFRADTPECRYWLGFIMADGAIIRRGPNQRATLAVVLSAVDRQHLEKLRVFLSSEHRLVEILPKPHRGYTSKPAVRLAIRCEQLAADLAARGIMPRKTFIAEAGALSRDRDFWRGVIDGDGSIGTYRAGDMLRLVGTQTLVAQFISFAQEHTATAATARPHRSIYETALVGRPARAVLAVLYADGDVALSRKANAAKEILRRGTAWLGVEADVGRPVKRQSEGPKGSETGQPGMPNLSGQASRSELSTHPGIRSESFISDREG